MEHPKSQQLALWYGYFGLIPLLALSVLLVIPVMDSSLLRAAYDSYSAIILAFMAGIYWSLALQGQGPACPARLMRASILLALWGWFALALPEVFRAMAFMLGFCVLYGIDRYVLEDLWSTAYLTMRGRLTLVVIATQVVVAVAG